MSRSFAPAPRGRRSVAAAVVLVWATFAGAVVTGLVEGTARAVAFDAVLASAALVVLGRALLVPEQRAVWSAAGVALLGWTFGDLYLWAAEPPDGALPIPSAADLGFLVLYAGLGVALVLAVRAQSPAVRGSLWLDGVATALAVTALLAAVTAGPFIDAIPSDGLLATAVNLAWPVCDLVLLGLVVVGVGLTGWRPGLQWALLAGGLTSMALADAVSITASGADAEGPSTLIELGWVTAATLLALASLAPRSAARAPLTSGVRGVAAPTATALLAVGLVLYDHVRGLETVAVLLAAATLLALAARTVLAVVELEREVRAHHHDALHDALTGLGNRRLLVERLDVAAATPPAHGRTRVLLLLDLDGFKRFNDGFGHLAGDALLARGGGRLRRTVAGRGEAFRPGGDEFCVIADVAEVDLDGLIDDVRAALSDRGDGYAVTPSVGVVRMPQDAQDPRAALRLADDRMYAQKRARRPHAVA